jgi:hypothetical protein
MRWLARDQLGLHGHSLAPGTNCALNVATAVITLAELRSHGSDPCSRFRTLDTVGMEAPPLDEMPRTCGAVGRPPRQERVPRPVSPNCGRRLRRVRWCRGPGKRPRLARGSSRPRLQRLWPKPTPVCKPAVWDEVRRAPTKHTPTSSGSAVTRGLLDNFTSSTREISDANTYPSKHCWGMALGLLQQRQLRLNASPERIRDAAYRPVVAPV